MDAFNSVDELVYFGPRAQSPDSALNGEMHFLAKAALGEDRWVILKSYFSIGQAPNIMAADLRRESARAWARQGDEYE